MNNSGQLAQFDPKIERTFHRYKNTIERSETNGSFDTKEQLAVVATIMENMGVVERSMIEYSLTTVDVTISNIAKPTVQVNYFEIKSAVIQIIQPSVQFSSLPDEDPNKHLANFLEICDNFKFNGVSDDAVRLRIFPFSLCDTTKDWLQPVYAGSITTWAAFI
ncbi:hypothetical protein Sango_2903000 [Sesamum angolense]|uniref:RING-H2 finger protein ATL63 n=1 Tax=Sesamum angolense TaxID=2727404 RepID=A0AAE1W003_9LAMI|nr:hypothetical protein Sango_2903000 [Sesamum angolense]